MHSRRLRTIDEVRALIDTHSALQSAESKQILRILCGKRANRALTILGHYLDYLEGFKSGTSNQVTRRRIAFFPGRARRVADRIEAGTVNSRQAEGFAQDIEWITDSVFGSPAKEAPEHLRSFACNPKSAKLRKQAAGSLRRFARNFQGADSQYINTFSRHRRHINAAQRYAVQFLTALKKETGSYRMKETVPLLKNVHRCMRVDLDYSEIWLRQLLSKHPDWQE